VGKTPHGEDVVLVEASWNFTLPQMASTQLIKVAALGHQHVFRTKFNPCRHAGGEFDHGNVCQIKVALLHIADTQIDIGKRSPAVPV
jgi:hypothetical protein